MKKVMAFLAFVVVPILAASCFFLYLAIQDYTAVRVQREYVVPWKSNPFNTQDSGEPLRLDFEVVHLTGYPYGVYTAAGARGFNDVGSAFAHARGIEGERVYVCRGELFIWGNYLEIKPKKTDVGLIAQKPELDRGCEVTALTMLINHFGIDVDKMTLAEKIAKTDYPGDPNRGFVGNMETFAEQGLGVYHAPIFDLLAEYFPVNAVDLTGADFDMLYYYLVLGRPVWVITSYYHSPVTDGNWHLWTVDGEPVRVTFHMHSVLVTGFDERYIYFNDPLEYHISAPIADFIVAWEQFGRQAVSLVFN
jgi:uncharacterized protein YvpB